MAGMPPPLPPGWPAAPRLQLVPVPQDSFAEAGPGPSTEDIEQESTRSTRGTRCELKQQDGRYDHRGNFSLSESSISVLANAEQVDTSAEFALVSTRLYDAFGMYQSTQLDIRSRFIKRALRKIIKYYPGRAVDVAELIIPEPFRPIVHYRQELEDYRHTKADEDTKAHLDLLFKFIDSTMKPKVDRFKDHAKRKIISFSLLWMLFRPGDLVFTVYNGQPSALVVQKMDNSSNDLGRCFRITGLGVDSNGERIGKVSRHVDIQDFDGTRDIMSLEIHPFKYHPDEQNIKERLLARGKRFLELQGVHHMNYKGQIWNVPDRNSLSHREMRHSWRPSQRHSSIQHEPIWFPGKASGRIMIDNASFCEHNSQHQVTFSVNDSSSSKNDPHERVQVSRHTSDKVELFEPPNFIPVHPQSPENAVQLQDKYIMLCSPFLLGFSLQSRSWCRFCIDQVQPVALNTEAFDQLILPAKHKELLFSMVKSHAAGDDAFDDIITGKGQSLIVLLYGEPGVGKTLTAESIADHTGRPLYSINSGDLGTFAHDVEERLRRVLDLASTWKAVVLLDEADVFLQERGKDVNRNALVSIFLRHLEYYPGILFLTSNRPLTFDPALTSRIHIALHYPPLTVPTRLALWTTFLDRLPAETLSPTFDKQAELTWLSTQPLNGRQIKNSVGMAVALARGMERQVVAGDLRRAVQARGGMGIGKLVGKEEKEDEEKRKKDAEEEDEKYKRALIRLQAS
ncbi:MAG: hypothetical protein M1814_003043 [Vezdaea aestivalis]|nr:MAG: hypothetical protein M1814_003043 [Vezdaea aestivalis]